MINKNIFITGGAGFLGKNIIKRLYNNNHITVYSRDEAKHYYLKKEYPKVNFVVGDIRDRDLLLRKSKGHNIGIFAASLKQIDACTENYEEASKIIIDGGINSRIVAEENNFESACFISSDKSRAATTIYGAMKYVAGECFVVGESNCNLTTVIYGNVMNSTGSIIPLIWNNIKNNKPISLYGIEMTRFLIDIDEAIDLILNALKYYKQCNVVPVAKSFLIKDLLDIYENEFGLKYYVTTPRTGEKIHETMISSEEVRRTEYHEQNNLYVLYPSKEINKLTFINNEYCSKDYCLSRDSLYKYLKERNFFK